MEVPKYNGNNNKNEQPNKLKNLLGNVFRSAIVIGMIGVTMYGTSQFTNKQPQGLIPQDNIEQVAKVQPEDASNQQPDTTNTTVTAEEIKQEPTKEDYNAAKNEILKDYFHGNNVLNKENPTVEGLKERGIPSPVNFDNPEIASNIRTLAEKYQKERVASNVSNEEASNSSKPISELIAAPTNPIIINSLNIPKYDIPNMNINTSWGFENEYNKEPNGSIDLSNPKPGYVAYQRGGLEDSLLQLPLSTNLGDPGMAIVIGHSLTSTNIQAANKYDTIFTQLKDDTEVGDTITVYDQAGRKLIFKSVGTKTVNEENVEEIYKNPMPGQRVLRLVTCNYDKNGNATDRTIRDYVLDSEASREATLANTLQVNK